MERQLEWEVQAEILAKWTAQEKTKKTRQATGQRKTRRTHDHAVYNGLPKREVVKLIDRAQEAEKKGRYSSIPTKQEKLAMIAREDDALANMKEAGAMTRGTSDYLVPVSAIWAVAEIRELKNLETTSARGDCNCEKCRINAKQEKELDRFINGDPETVASIGAWDLVVPVKAVASDVLDKMSTFWFRFETDQRSSKGKDVPATVEELIERGEV